MILRNMIVYFCLVSKKNKCSSIGAIDKTNLTEQTKFRLDENYFIEEINQRKSCSQKLNKYVTTFDYVDKILIVLVQQLEEYQLFHLQVLLKHQLE